MTFVLTSWWTAAVEHINLSTWTTLFHYESPAVGMQALRLRQRYSSWVCHLCTQTSAFGWHRWVLCRSFQQRCPRTFLVLWALAMFKELPSRGMYSRLVFYGALLWVNLYSVQLYAQCAELYILYISHSSKKPIDVWLLYFYENPVACVPWHFWSL